mgnify:FL=1
MVINKVLENKALKFSTQCYPPEANKTSWITVMEKTKRVGICVSSHVLFVQKDMKGIM